MKTFYATSLYLLITCLTSVNGQETSFAIKNEGLSACMIVTQTVQSSVDEGSVALLVIYFDYKLYTLLIY